MKIFGKNLLLSSSISAIAFACTFAHAAPKIDATYAEKNLIQNTYMFFVPQVATEGLNRVKEVSLQVRYIQDSPMLPKVTPKPSAHYSCKAKKKHNLYELSAIFNDKLQLLLSYFNEESPKYVVEKQVNPEDLSVNNNIRL